MYKVIKGRGAGATITVLNTDTMAGVNIGTPRIPILEVLDKEGYSPVATVFEKRIELNLEWDIVVTEETAKELARKALSMRKPVRKQAEKTVEKPKQANKPPVDIFNLIFKIEE